VSFGEARSGMTITRGVVSKLLHLFDCQYLSLSSYWLDSYRSLASYRLDSSVLALLTNTYQYSTPSIRSLRYWLWTNNPTSEGPAT